MQCLNQSSTKFGVDINAERTRRMTDNLESTQDSTKVSTLYLQRINVFKYLGSNVDEGF